MEKIQKLKNIISQVKRELKNEPDNHKKQRLNKYKQKLEIELRNYIFFKNGGRYEAST
ncbi:MAG: hypothetical protein J6R47_03505 [Acholeplasmatales bacterium]|nr:hypothetical protein [Acholeplasmatales bacterium]